MSLDEHEQHQTNTWQFYKNNMINMKLLMERQRNEIVVSQNCIEKIDDLNEILTYQVNLIPSNLSYQESSLAHVLNMV